MHLYSGEIKYHSMLIYIFFIVLAIVFCLRTTKYANNTYLALWLMLLALFVGFADMLGGYDRYIYGEVFDNIADQTRAGVPISDYEYLGHDNEVGYQYFNVLFSFITANRYIFILCETLIIYFLFYLTLRKYLSNQVVFVPLFLALFFFFTFTYIREILAVALMGLSYKYVLERKFIKFFALFVIAVLIHNSTIVFFLFYFIPIKQYSKTTVVIIAILLLLIGLSPLPRLLFMQYGSLSDDIRIEQNLDAMGFRLEYLIEAVFFLFVILNNYEKLGKNKGELVFLNASLVFCFILLLFVQSVTGGRLSWFFILGILVTLSNLYSSMSRAYKALILSVSLFLYFRILFAWGIFLYPYKTFFTNGHREGDRIFQRYEYDLNYDRDKFYR